MSYFLCGNFVLAGETNSAARDKLAFEIVEAGCANRLSVQLGAGIVQPLVFEIIAVNCGRPTDSEVPFLITNSPLSDVSDELIDSDDVDGEEKLGRTLERLHSFLSEIEKADEISEVVLYFSEGFDSEYTIVDSTLSKFAENRAELISLSAEKENFGVRVRLRE